LEIPAEFAIRLVWHDFQLHCRFPRNLPMKLISRQRSCAATCFLRPPLAGLVRAVGFQPARFLHPVRLLHSPFYSPRTPFSRSAAISPMIPVFSHTDGRRQPQRSQRTRSRTGRRVASTLVRSFNGLAFCLSPFVSAVLCNTNRRILRAPRRFSTNKKRGAADDADTRGENTNVETSEGKKIAGKK
jgi:hypothetical protein